VKFHKGQRVRSRGELSPPRPVHPDIPKGDEGTVVDISRPWLILERRYTVRFDTTGRMLKNLTDDDIEPIDPW